MKQAMIKCAGMILLISIVALVAACGRDAVDLKVEKWGPRSMVAGKIPNKQPGGVMGLWIIASGVNDLGQVQVLFDGQPANTRIRNKGIVAAIDPKQLTKPGKKEVAVKQISTGKIFPVGVFEVQAAQ